VLALQRAAGNGAVAGLLARPAVGRVGRALQRMTDEDVASLDKKEKRVYLDALKLYNDNFSGGKPYARDAESWSWFVEQADDVDGLLASVKSAVVAAAARAQAAAAQPSASSAPPPSKKLASDTPASASASAAQPASAEEHKGEPEEPVKPKKSRKGTPLDLGSIQAPPLWEKPPSIASGPMHAAAAAAAKAPKPFDVSLYTSALAAWKTSEHGGKRATDLSVEEVREIVDFATHTWSRKNAVYIRRGAGSGEWSGKVQLKIIHVSQTTSSGKRSTFHFTLSAQVYGQLAEVPELDE
jgi:hypothetical protein